MSHGSTQQEGFQCAGTGLVAPVISPRTDLSCPVLPGCSAGLTTSTKLLLWNLLLPELSTLLLLGLWDWVWTVSC